MRGQEFLGKAAASLRSRLQSCSPPIPSAPWGTLGKSWCFHRRCRWEGEGGACTFLHLLPFLIKLPQEPAGPLPLLQGSRPTSLSPELPVKDWAASPHLPMPRRTSHASHTSSHVCPPQTTGMSACGCEYLGLRDQLFLIFTIPETTRHARCQRNLVNTTRLNVVTRHPHLVSFVPSALTLSLSVAACLILWTCLCIEWQSRCCQ